MYCHACTVYRAAVDLLADGQPDADGLEWATVAAGVACYLEDVPVPLVVVSFLQLEGGSSKRLHFPMAADVKAFDVFLLTTHPQASLVGKYWRATEAPSDHDFAAGKRILGVAMTVKPNGIA